MKKLIAALMALSIASVFVVGCSKPAEETGNSETQQKQDPLTDPDM